MAIKLINEVMENAFNGEELVVGGVGFNEVPEIEEDLAAAFVECRENCSAFQMDMCEKNGILPGMRECK